MIHTPQINYHHVRLETDGGSVECVVPYAGGSAELGKELSAATDDLVELEVYGTEMQTADSLKEVLGR